MTFSQRVRARWRASIIAFCAGLLVAEVLVWVLMSFVVFVALSSSGVALSPELQRMFLIVVQIAVLLSACCMWLARGIQLSSDVNAVIAGASPLQKQFLGMQLTEEGNAETGIAKVERLITDQAVPVVDLTGSVTRPER
jgi:hypothetical protein